MSFITGGMTSFLVPPRSPSARGSGDRCPASPRDGLHLPDRVQVTDAAAPRQFVHARLKMSRAHLVERALVRPLEHPQEALDSAGMEASPARTPGSCASPARPRSAGPRRPTHRSPMSWHPQQRVPARRPARSPRRWNGLLWPSPACWRGLWHPARPFCRRARPAELLALAAHVDLVHLQRRGEHSRVARSTIGPEPHYPAGERLEGWTQFQSIPLWCPACPPRPAPELATGPGLGESPPTRRPPPPDTATVALRAEAGIRMLSPSGQPRSICLYRADPTPRHTPHGVRHP